MSLHKVCIPLGKIVTKPWFCTPLASSLCLEMEDYSDSEDEYRHSISNKSKIIAIKFKTHFILIFSKENSWNVIYFFYLLHPLLPARFIRLSHFVLTAHKITWLQSEIIVGLSNDGFSLDKIPKPGVYIEELKFLP